MNDWGGEYGQARDLISAIDRMKVQRSELARNLEAERDALSNADSRFREVKAEVKSLKLALKQVQSEAASLSQLDQKDLETMRELQTLMNKNESLKKKETEYKTKCNVQRSRLMERNQSLRDQILENPPDEGTKEKEIAELQLILSSLKTELASKSGKVSELEGKLDNVPSSYEMQQYQKRFLELDNELAAEFSATQRYITMYNTLLDQKSFTETSIGLLESVMDALPDPKYSSSNVKAQFVDKMTRLLQDVQAAKGNYTKTLRNQEVKKAEADEELNRLMEIQRKYDVLVKEMQEEMKRHETLNTVTHPD